jgi:phosphatidylglycerol---prolipoprotein diacylglyceryl transferase
MHPILFHLGPIPITTYGVLEMIGFAAAIYWSCLRARKCGADEEIMINVGLLSLIVGMLGGRTFYVVHHWPLFMATDNPLLAIVNISAGGFEFYGGFLAAVTATVIYLWAKGKSLRWYLDIICPTVMVGAGFGRIGCFFAGCCWGVTTSLPVGVHFDYGPPPSSTSGEIPTRSACPRN